MRLTQGHRGGASPAGPLCPLCGMGDRRRRSPGSFPRGSQAVGGPCSLPTENPREQSPLGPTRRGSAWSRDLLQAHTGCTPAPTQHGWLGPGLCIANKAPGNAGHGSLDPSHTALSWDVFHVGTSSSGRQHVAVEAPPHTGPRGDVPEERAPGEGPRPRGPVDPGAGPLALWLLAQYLSVGHQLRTFPGAGVFV